MRVVISADIEGASGVVSAKQGRENTAPWQEARRLLLGDVNAAIEGALTGGATEVIVHDSHGLDAINIPFEGLHPRAQAVYGQPVLFYEQLELDARLEGGVACAFLVGYHARPGEPAVLSHLYDWPLLQEVRLNDKAAGEGAVAAALAAAYGIPTTLVTGDDATAAEMKAWCPDIETAVVKHALSRYAARCLPLKETRERIRAAAERATRGCKRHRLTPVSTPVRLEVRFASEQIARTVAWMPGVTRRERDWVCYEAADMPTAFRCLNAMFAIAESPLAPKPWAS